MAVTCRTPNADWLQERVELSTFLSALPTPQNFLEAFTTFQTVFLVAFVSSSQQTLHVVVASHYCSIFPDCKTLGKPRKVPLNRWTFLAFAFVLVLFSGGLLSLSLLQLSHGSGRVWGVRTLSARRGCSSRPSSSGESWDLCTFAVSFLSQAR